METKVTKGKVTTFVKEHKKELLAGLGLMVVSGVVGWKLNTWNDRRKDRVFIESESIKRVLCDAQSKYGISTIFAGSMTDGDYLKPEDLGKLGEGMSKINANNESLKFTHFIAIGPDNR